MRLDVLKAIVALLEKEGIKEDLEVTIFPTDNGYNVIAEGGSKGWYEYHWLELTIDYQVKEHRR